MKKKTSPFERVDKALAVFMTTVTELESAAKDHADAEAEHLAESARRAETAAVHGKAAAEATRIANKIAELVY